MEGAATILHGILIPKNRKETVAILRIVGTVAISVRTCVIVVVDENRLI